ncbi:hypothetical protein MNBD_GAMMA26-311 [hydrothermal vent metagenome]|uniref:DUF4340 domain-containing protein n=1 Tax=hydrothermal vent metagenome TaxID=652676 RepID=A0A3B1BC00_9ZZZZ
MLNYHSRTIINLGLLILVVVLVLITLYEPGLDETEHKLPLTNLNPTEINSIRISDTKGRELILKKLQGHWQMTSPHQEAADETRIAQLLGIATTRSFSHFIVPEDRLAEFGLNPAPIQLKLNNVTLEIGGNESLRFRRYVRIGDQIHLISNGFHHHLMAQPDDFIAPNR